MKKQSNYEYVQSENIKMPCRIQIYEFHHPLIMFAFMCIQGNVCKPINHVERQLKLVLIEKSWFKLTEFSATISEAWNSNMGLLVMIWTACSDCTHLCTYYTCIPYILYYMDIVQRHTFQECLLKSLFN